MKLQATITKLKVTLLVALSFFSSIGFSQNFNEYFKRGNNNNTFFNGVTNFNDSIIGVANYFDGSVDVIEIIVFSDSGKILFSKKSVHISTKQAGIMIATKLPNTILTDVTSCK